MPGLKVHDEESRNGIVSFGLEGVLDAHNFETLEALFEKHFEAGVYRFVVDLSRLKYVSSAGAGVFIGAVGVCQDNDGNIVLVQPSQEVREIFELLGVLHVFPVVQDRSEAAEVFSKSTA